MRTAHAQRTRWRLWKAGAGLALFLFALLVANQLLRPGHALHVNALGHDFLASYTAGSFVNNGRTADLYDLSKVTQFQADLARREGLADNGRFPYWNPPFYSLFFAPLAKLSFSGALGIWWLISIASFAAAMFLLGRLMISGIDSDRSWRTWGLLPLLAGCSMPFIQTLTHGQNSMISLLLMTAAVLAWRKAASHQHDDDAQASSDSSSERVLRPSVLWPYIAGLLAGLMFYKPQLAAIFAGILAIHLGRRAIVGTLISGGALLAVNTILLPGTLMDFLHRLPANLQAWQVDQPYYWHRHATFKAFWRLLLQGTSPGELHWTAAVLAGVSVAFLGAALLAAAIRCRKSADADGLIAATIAAAPLLMPFYFDYDLLLLIIPAVLMIRRRMLDEDAVPHGFAWLLGGVYMAMYLTPALSASIRFNLTVPALCLLAIALIRHAYYSVESLAVWLEQAPPVTLRRAQAA